MASDSATSGQSAEAGDSGAESMLTSRSDIELTRKERYEQLFDAYVLTPGKIAWSDWRTRTGFLIILGYLLMGTVGVLAVHVPAQNEAPRLVQPFQSMANPLGTDHLGRDILALIVHATPPLLKMMASGAVFAVAVAVVVGTASGYKRGNVDRVLMTLTDIMMTIPGLILIIVIAVIFSPENPYVIGIILSINAWAGLARTLRSQVLTLRNEPYVEASRTMGMDTHRILAKDIIPNLMPYIAVNFVGAARRIIFSSVGLYFLGVLPHGTPNWGVILNQAYNYGAFYLEGTLHWLLIPLFVIILISFGFVLLAQGLDRVFNPRIRARHVKRADDDQSKTTPTS